MPELATAPTVECAVAARPRRGERVSGDLALVRALRAGTLLAVLDGVGHGPDALRAARAAGDVIARTDDHDLGALMEHCHHALLGTRGAAVTLALLAPDAAMLRWLGVGTVEGRLVGARGWPSEQRASLRLLSGTPGHDLPALSAASVRLRSGDVAILATDGVSASFADALTLEGSPQDVADRILAAHGRATDDALVAVARYLEGRR